MLTFNQGFIIAERYKLIKLLGRGGFSEVWLTEDVLTQTKAAIKIYAPGVGLDDAGISIFTQEFSLVFDMNHSNLLRPTHYDCWENMPFLILPYCQNGSVFKYLSADVKISEKEAWKLLHDVAAGLAYLHGKELPILHQDIKPDNILISDEGHYMITDFGISARIRSTINKSQPEMSGGTLAYMGPERFSKTPSPIMASDIWSLGAMMYEVLTGMPPYGNHGGMLQKNGADIPIIEADYSQTLKDVVYSCISLNTWDRPTAAELETYCNKFLNNNNDVNNIEKKIGKTCNHITNDSNIIQDEIKTDISTSKEVKHVNTLFFKRKNGLIIGTVAGLVLILALSWILTDKSSDTDEQPQSEMSVSVSAINYDSIYFDYIKDAKRLVDNAESLMYPTIKIDSVTIEDTLNQALIFFQKASEMESLVLEENYRKNEIDAEITKLDSLLNELQSFFMEKSELMKQLNLPEQQQGFDNRILNIKNIKLKSNEK